MLRQYMKISFFVMLILSVSRAGANIHNPLLLRAQASIFPKIVLLDHQLAKKMTGNEVVLTIISTSEDEHTALLLKGSIEDLYKNNLGNNKLTVNNATFENFNREAVATAYIVFHGPEQLLRDVVSHASQHDRIVFSHDYADFRYDALISLLVKEKTYIYLNKSAVKLYDINFPPLFYKIIKIIE